MNALTHAGPARNLAKKWRRCETAEFDLRDFSKDKQGDDSAGRAGDASGRCILGCPPPDEQRHRLLSLLQPASTGTAFLFWTDCVAHRPNQLRHYGRLRPEEGHFGSGPRSPVAALSAPGFSRSPPASNLTPGNLLFSDQLALAAGFLLSRHVTPPLFDQNLLLTSLRANDFSRSAGDSVPLRT